MNVESFHESILLLLRQPDTQAVVIMDFDRSQRGSKLRALDIGDEISEFGKIERIDSPLPGRVSLVEFELVET